MTESSEQQPRQRWYRCSACDVSWHGFDTVCWSCDTDVTVISNAAPRFNSQSGYPPANFFVD